MGDFLSVMFWPLWVCWVLAGIHAYLGLHVIQRQVIFVDLALAQVAALGSALAMAAGWGMEDPRSYAVSLGFALIGAAIFSVTRFRDQRIQQEVMIGIVYAVSAAVGILVLSRTGEGDEHIRRSLIGNILLVKPEEVWRLFWLYGGVGIFHFVFRRTFFLISVRPEEAYRRGVRVRLWDFLFYASFGWVVTSSVRVAGVLLVFAYLVVPAACAALFAKNLKSRLMLGWFFGGLASVAGMAGSYFLDFPAGASVVSFFGGMMAVCVLFSRGFRRRSQTPSKKTPASRHSESLE